jgi:hypothetical protein
MEEPTTEQQPALERRYANFLRVGFNQSEFLLDFAQSYEGVAPVLHTHLVASPLHARRFAELLDSCVEDYDALYGPAANAPPQP